MDHYVAIDALIWSGAYAVAAMPTAWLIDIYTNWSAFRSYNEHV
jgi:hypothetical protein